MARYRVVRDTYAGFEVQAWRWWWPLWWQVGFCNTHGTVEAAEAYARAHANQVVVKEVDLSPQDTPA